MGQILVLEPKIIFTEKIEVVLTNFGDMTRFSEKT